MGPQLRSGKCWIKVQMKNLAKKSILGIKPYEPGKPIEEVRRELGLTRLIKLASNENPLGPSPAAVRAAEKALGNLNRYPDGNCFYLKRALAGRLRVKQSNIVLGNGSNEIIELLVRAFLNKGEQILTSRPSFLIYDLAGKAEGAKMVSIPLKNFKYDLEAMKKRVNKRTKLIFIGNPNNPTGTYVNSKEVKRFLEKLPCNSIVVFDEAYYDFVTESDFPRLLRKLNRNVVILRTFSKAYGLSGLRIGFGIAREGIIKCLNTVRQPFNVNSLAQVAALAALNDEKHLKQTLEIIREGKEYLYKEFGRMGLNYVESATNFILLNIESDGNLLFRKLLKKGVIIRDMRVYGLHNFIRVTVGLMSENRRFIKTLKEVARWKNSKK